MQPSHERAPNTPCPGVTEVLLFAKAKLHETARTTFEQHIDRCVSCRRLAVEIVRQQATPELADTLNHPVDSTHDHPQLLMVDPDHYVLDKEIARGGMGRILAARDRRHGRPVAIKELLTASGAMQARFEREVRITAMLQHPSIVSLLEAGTWPDGQPFYAMKLVSGASLASVIAARPTLEARLALLPNVIAAADALAYAHSKRVIHRDLKPSNVLVGEFGETVVIDWGLAKDLGDPSSPEISVGPYRSAADAGETASGSVIGTPAYMPVEQATGGVVDARADVYALGAMLYHVLAGAPPFTGEHAAAVLEQVVAGPPQPIGERVLGLPHDLVAIVDQAMARAASDRYPTARELAEDLKKFQTGQLVGVHRYTTWQLVRRWLRRHRAAVAVASAATLALIIVLVVSVTKIVDERERAEQSRADAEELMGFMLGDLRDKLEPVGKLELLDTVAKKAQAYYEKRSDPSSAESQRKHALARRNLGDVLQARGDLPAALSEYRAGFAIVEKVAAADPSNTDAQRELAFGHVKIGDMIMNEGDVTGGLASYRASLTIRETLVARDPTNAALQRELAISHDRVADALLATGDLAPGSLVAARASLAIREKLAARDPSDSSLQYALSVSHSKVGNALVEQGDLSGALAEYRSGLTISERLATRDPTNTAWQRDLSANYEAVGDVVREQGDRAAALVAYRSSRAIRQRLAELDPSNTLSQRDLMVSHTKVGETLTVDGDLAGAVTAHEAARNISAALAAKDPSNAEWQRDLAISHFGMGHALRARGEPAKALVEYRAALDIRKKLAGSDSANVIAQYDLWITHVKVGALLHKRNELADALREYSAALPIIEKLANAETDNGRLQIELAGTHEAIGDVLQSQRAGAEALASYRIATDIVTELTSREPSNEQSKAALANLSAKTKRAVVANNRKRH